MTASARVALVTGGGAGIGAATCERLAQAGHAIGVLGPRAENTRAVAEQINAAGGRAIDLQADVSDRAQLAAAFSRLRAAFGPVTVLVNNAGIEEFTPFADITEQAWDRVMDVNLKGIYHAVQLVLPAAKAVNLRFK